MTSRRLDARARQRGLAGEGLQINAGSQGEAGGGGVISGGQRYSR